MNSIADQTKAIGSFYTLPQINAAFAQIETLLNNKIDCRGTNMLADLKFVDGSIINVPVTTDSETLAGVVNA